jgi:hypothetical protein
MRASLLFCCTLAGMIGADPVRAAPVPVVTLPTILNGVGSDRAAWQKAMDDKLDEGIRASGRTPMLPGPLTGAELACREPECMARVAEGAGGGIVLGAKVIGDRGSPPSYKLVLTRFDHDRPGTVRQETVECAVCTQADAADRLGQMIATMMPSLVVQPPPRHPPVEAAQPTPPTAVAAAPERTVPRKLLWAAIGVSAASGAAGLAMLGVGMHALAIDGSAVGSAAPGAQPRELYDTRGAGIGLTVAGSLLVVSAAVELGFEIWLLKKRAR